jgi:hypothetical protein
VRYKLDLVGVQEVRWDKRGTKRAGDYIFFFVEKETKITNWEQKCLYTASYYQQLTKVDFISDRLSYIVLRARWCNIIVVNTHAPTGKKSDYSKDSFYEE